MELRIPRDERQYAVLDHYAAAPFEWAVVLVLAIPNLVDEGSCIAVMDADGNRRTVTHARVINYVEADEIETGEGFRLLLEGFRLAGEDQEGSLGLAASALEALVDLDRDLGE